MIVLGYQFRFFLFFHFGCAVTPAYIPKIRLAFFGRRGSCGDRGGLFAFRPILAGTSAQTKEQAAAKQNQ